MEELLIRKSDIENLGRKLMKEVYNFLHDEYFLGYEVIKVEKDNIERYLVEYYLKDIHKIKLPFVCDVSKKELEDENKYKDINLINMDLKLDEIDEIKYKEYEKELKDESKYKEYLKEIENKIEDESLDIDIIFKVLDLIKLEYQLDEDLSSKKQGFIFIYNVFNHYHEYLKD